jgi:hypothetical protein
VTESENGALIRQSRGARCLEALTNGLPRLESNLKLTEVRRSIFLADSWRAMKANL